MRRTFRKPLIVMSPKKLLRYKDACSDLSEFDSGLRFNRVYDEASTQMPKDKVRKVILCSGQVYYDILHARNNSKVNDVAILRLEELCPFPYKVLVPMLEQYKNAKEIVWCQEEHSNQGAWFYVQPRLNNALEWKLGRKGQSVKYIGRGANSSTATGYHKVHEQELVRMMKECMA